MVKRLFNHFKWNKQFQSFVIKGFITRDNNGNLYFSKKRPIKDFSTLTWNRTNSFDYMDIHKGTYDPFAVIRIPNDRIQFKA